MSTISGNGHSNGTGRKPAARNVLGGKLKECGSAPLTGFFRDGCCNTGPDDHGVHVVCTRVTAEFLKFTNAPVPIPRPRTRRSLVCVCCALEGGAGCRPGGAGGFGGDA